MAETLASKGRNAMELLYGLMLVKMYSQRAILCKYGEMGDCFFIILKGLVNVLAPKPYSRVFMSYFEIFKFLLEEEKFIAHYKDQNSKKVRKFIEIIGSKILK